MAEPIPFRVLRYRCPHCPRTGSSKARITEHIGRCWLNPEVRGCKTCKHFEPYGPENGDGCAVGVDLSGRPACVNCGGPGDPWNPCEHCTGSGAEIKPGPIVGCDRWEAVGVPDDEPQTYWPTYPATGEPPAEWRLP
jgi:hypothetical protein